MPANLSGFQTFVNKELPVGVPGDWAGAQIRASIPVGPWALVAPPSGTVVGAIGWANPATGICSSYYQPSSFSGMVQRNQRVSITTFLGMDSMIVNSGYEVTCLSVGDFWGLFQGGATIGQKVYANPTNGALLAAATGGSVTVTSNSAGMTIANGVLTVTTADVTGTPAVGQILTAPAGVGVPPGTYLASSAGTGTGTTLWNLANLDGAAIPNVSTAFAGTLYGQQETQFVVAQNVPADSSFTATLTASGGQAPYGTLDVTAVASGAILPGQWLYSSGTVPVPITANIYIVSQLSGTPGGVGTYITSNTITVSTAQTFSTTQGQMAKISSLTTWL